MKNAGQRATGSACTIRLLRKCGMEGVPYVMDAWACKVILSAIGCADRRRNLYEWGLALSAVVLIIVCHCRILAMQRTARCA